MSSPFCLVLSGGVALGAYQAGVHEALERAGRAIDWIAGSSVGAVNGALIAGVPAARRGEALRGYWLAGTPWPPLARSGPLRQAYNWMNIAQARLLGSSRHLHMGGRDSLYSLDPTADFLRATVDFGLLNSGAPRFTVATVDIESGESVFFDSATERIGLEHVLASCGFLPEFAPVEIAGRLLGDGGLAVNAPIEPMLEALEGAPADRRGTVLIADLYARDGARPDGLHAALERKNGLLFGNQTQARLEIFRRFWQRHGLTGPSIYALSYRPTRNETVPEAPFDFSRITAEERWREGALDAAEAIARLEKEAAEGGTFVAIRRRGE